MDWDKLKKSIINTASIFVGLAILFACLLGIDYIALTHPIVAISITLIVLFCLVVAMYYLIL